MVAGLVVSIDGGLKLTAMEKKKINYHELREKTIYFIMKKHTSKGIEITFRKMIRSFRGGGGTRGGLQLPGFKRLAQ